MISALLFVMRQQCSALLNYKDQLSLDVGNHWTNLFLNEEIIKVRHLVFVIILQTGQKCTSK